MTLDTILLYLPLANFLLVFLILPVLRHLHKIRHNELEHVARDLTELKEALEKLHTKLDSHITWHLSHKD